MTVPGKGGPPLKYKTVEELEKAIQDYFDKCQPEPYKDKEGNILCDSKGKPMIKVNPPTITGLAIALGFSDRRSIYDYKEKPQFAHTIKKARLICENYAELRLLSGDVPPAGPIFILKNYGWRDKQEIDMNATINRIKYDDDDDNL